MPKKFAKREKEALFKLFLRRIGFKNFDEYMKLFGDNIEKRIECVQWFLQTYPNLALKK